MTDKEIIIDGVDVSKCYGYVHNAKEYDCGETYSKFHYRYCEENPNCYFKQLKRKEQECEELKKIKKENITLIKENFDKNIYIKRLVQEYDELTKYIKEAADLLGLKINATVLGLNCIGYWAILSSSINNAIENKKQECEEINLTNERLVAEKHDLNEEILKFKNEIKEYKQATLKKLLTKQRNKQ